MVWHECVGKNAHTSKLLRLRQQLFEMEIVRLFVEDRLATVGTVYHMVHFVADIDARCSSHEEMHYALLCK